MRNSLTVLACSLAPVSLAVFLGSCKTTQQPEIPQFSELNIYQPSILVIPAGQMIQTTTGKYTPETDEIWHSDKRVRDMERSKY